MVSASPIPPFSVDAPRKPTVLEREAETVLRQRGACPLLLKQDNGEWSFAGDGRMGEFVPPLAPLPEEKNPVVAARFPKGAEVEVNPAHMPPHCVVIGADLQELLTVLGRPYRRRVLGLLVHCRCVGDRGGREGHRLRAVPHARGI